MPTYSNPTGDTLSAENVERLARMKTGAADFTIFADDAYRVHHLTDDPPEPVNILEACKSGRPPRPRYSLRIDLENHLRWGGAGVFGLERRQHRAICPAS